MIRARLEHKIKLRGGFSPSQFGFRKWRSTVQAVENVVTMAKVSTDRWVLMVMTDIKNATNTAPWD